MGLDDVYRLEFPRYQFYALKKAIERSVRYARRDDKETLEQILEYLNGASPTSQKNLDSWFRTRANANHPEREKKRKKLRVRSGKNFRVR